MEDQYFGEVLEALEEVTETVERMRHYIREMKPERFHFFGEESKTFFEKHKGDLMTQYDDLVAGVTALGSALTDTQTRVSTDLTNLNAEIATLQAAGSASIPLTSLEPLITSVTGFVSQATTIDPAPVVVPPPAA